MLTLPYIYTINSLDKNKRNKIIAKLRYHAKRKEAEDIKNIIINSGGIEYTETKINMYTQMALDELKDYGDSKSKSLLVDMLDFNVRRKY